MSNYGVNNQIKSNVQVSFDNPLYVSKETNQSKTNNDPIKTLTNTFQPQEVKVNLPNKEVRMDGTGLDIDKQISVANKNHDKQKNAVSNDVLKNLAFDTFDDDGNEIEGMGGENYEGNINDEINADLKDLRNRMGTTGTGGETKARGFTELENELKADLKIFDEIKAPKTEVNTTVTIVQIDKKASLKDVQVATDTVKKDVAPKDEEAKDLGKSGGILKSIKNFFTWVANLFTGGKKKEEAPDTTTAPKTQARTENISTPQTPVDTRTTTAPKNTGVPVSQDKPPLTETQAKVLDRIGDNLETIKSEPGDFKKVYANLTKGEKFGGDNLMFLAQGKVSMQDGSFNVEGRYDYNDQEKSMQVKLISKFIDDMIPKALKSAENTNNKNKLNERTKDMVTHWTDALKNSLEGKIRTEKTVADVNSMLDIVLEGIDKNGTKSHKKEKAELRKLVSDLKEQYGNPSNMRENGLKDFKRDLGEQLKMPDSFFRGNTSAGTTSKSLLKLESPNVQLKANTEMLKIIREFAKDGLEDFSKLEKSDQLRAAVSLANKFVDAYFGTTAEQNRDFAKDNIGPQSKLFLKGADTEITNANVPENAKSTAKDRWNSNTFILRTVGEMVAEVSVQLNKETKGLGTVLVRIQDVLTQAANNIQESEKGKKDREFLEMPEYGTLRTKLPIVLGNVVSGC